MVEGKKIDLKIGTEGLRAAGTLASNYAIPEYFLHSTAVIDDNVTIGRVLKYGTLRSFIYNPRAEIRRMDEVRSLLVKKGK